MSTIETDPPEVADEVVDPAASSPIAEYNATAAALAELRKRLAGKAYDLRTTAGDKEARADRLELTRLISALEARRKELKAPVLERGRLLDAEAQRITGELEKLREPIDAAIKADERRREEERQAREAAERERVAKLRTRIDYMRGVAARAAGKPAAEVRAKIDMMAGLAIGEDFGEFLEEARTVHAEVTQQLREMLAAVEAQEAEAARLRAEREVMQAKAAEDSLVASIHAAAVLVEQESTPYIQKAITAFESAVKAWEPDARDRVAHAIAAGRSQLTARLAAAQERERIAAEQAAEAQRLAAERAEIDERRALDTIDRLEAGCATKDAAGVAEVIAALLTDPVQSGPVESPRVQERRDRALAALRPLMEHKARSEATLRAAQEQAENAAAQNSQRHESAGTASLADQTPVVPAGAAQAEGETGASAPVSPGSSEAPSDARTISQNAEESGSSLADAPAPGDAPGMCASAGPEASNGSVIAGDEGPVAQEVLRAADPAPAPEQPTIKLGDLCAEIGDGFKMSEAFVSGALGVHCTKGDRGAVLYTRTQRRLILSKLCDRLAFLGREVHP